MLYTVFRHYGRPRTLRRYGCGNTAMKGAFMHKHTRHERTRGFTLIELLDSDPTEEVKKEPED